MQLSKRLQGVANLVTRGQRVADVGCDHAYTSIYMIKEGIATHVIAMDINKGPLEKAKANIKAHCMTEHIETRLSDGAKKLEVNEVDALLISGMGGALMIKILSDRMEVFHSLKEVILQPQSEIHLVRKFLHEQGFVIEKEIFLKEDGKFYVAMKAKNLHTMTKEEQETALAQYSLSYDRECYYYYGKQLLEEKHEVLEEFLAREVSMREEIIEALRVKHTENSFRRQEELKKELEILSEAQKFYTE